MTNVELDGVDQVLVADTVLPMSGPLVEATAVALRGGEIAAVGGHDLVQHCRRGGAQVTHLGNKTVIPGLIDPHVHYEIASVALMTGVSIHSPPCRSIGDVIDTLRDGRHMADARGGWLVGEGNLMQDQRLAERRLPTRHDLDKVSTRIPIALRIGSHTTVLNSVGLDRAGVGTTFRPPRGALLERDPGGRLTGVAREIFYHLPIPWPDREALRSVLTDGVTRGFTSNGVTTIGEIPRTREAVDMMAELAGSVELPCRIRAFLRAGPMGSTEELVEQAPDLTASSANPGMFRAQGIKLFSDGGLSSATAAMAREYAIRPGSRGRMGLTSTQLKSRLSAIGDAGLQPMVHAVGERAQAAVCTAALATGLQGLGPRQRLRLEHAGNFVGRPDTIQLWRDAEVVPVPNIVMLYSFGSSMPTYLGEYAERGRFPLKSLLNDGWRLSTGSDVTGDEPRGTNPFFGIWAAVGRRSVTGELIEPEEAISVEEALRLYTIHAAEALGDADQLGSLEPGKRADIVVLDRDPRKVATDELLDIRVERVYLNGAAVFAS